MSLDVLVPRCAALDVHKDQVTVCMLTPEGSEVKTYGTTTSRIKQMAKWLVENKVTLVAMESTGVYWKPIWNLMEALDEIKLLLVDAKEVKNVPGRKTDVKDAEWIAILLSRGLLSSCYVPSRDQRQLRDITRLRRKVIGQRSSLYQRLDKILVSNNVRVSSVFSKIGGKTSMNIIKAMADGETEPERLADYADHPRIKASREAIEEALEGVLDDHDRFVLRRLLRLIEAHTDEIEIMDGEVAKRLLPFEDLIQRMDGVPGVDRRTAEDVLAEVGTTNWKEAFSSPDKLNSWAKLSPGNFISAGRRKGGKWQQGKAPYINSIMFQAAKSASRTGGSYAQAQYRRLASKRGAKRAWGAVACSLLEALYYMVTRGEEYRELGGDYFERLREDRIVKRTVARLRSLGYDVLVTKKVPA